MIPGFVQSLWSWINPTTNTMNPHNDKEEEEGVVTNDNHEKNDDNQHVFTDTAVECSRSQPVVDCHHDDDHHDDDAGRVQEIARQPKKMKVRRAISDRKGVPLPMRETRKRKQQHREEEDAKQEHKEEEENDAVDQKQQQSILYHRISSIRANEQKSIDLLLADTGATTKRTSGDGEGQGGIKKKKKNAPLIDYDVKLKQHHSSTLDDTAVITTPPAAATTAAGIKNTKNNKDDDIHCDKQDTFRSPRKAKKRRIVVDFGDDIKKRWKNASSSSCVLAIPALVPISHPDGVLLLGDPDDTNPNSHVLNAMHIFIRQQIEVFQITKEDVLQIRQGQKNILVEYQIGLRCIHCRHLSNPQKRRFAHYPTSIESIYSLVKRLKYDHFDCCPGMLPETRCELEQLKKQFAHSPKKPSSVIQYYNQSALEMGLMNFNHRVYFISSSSSSAS